MPMPRDLSNADQRTAGVDSGFNSLLQAPEPEDMSDQVQARPVPAAPSDSNPPSGGIGGFTALLKGFSQSSAEVPPLPNTSDKAAGGEFTQLFRKLSPKATSSTNLEVGTPKREATSAPTGSVLFDPAGERSSELSSFTDLIRRSANHPPGLPRVQNRIPFWPIDRQTDHLQPEVPLYRTNYIRRRRIGPKAFLPDCSPNLHSRVEAR